MITFKNNIANRSEVKIPQLRDCRLKTCLAGRHAANFLSLILTAYCLLAFSIEINPTIRYVSPTGNNIPPYLTWEDAANSIQDCINVSVSGDTIYVANGVYEEQVVMINGLSLIGAGIDSCIIDTRSLVTTIDFTSVTVADSCLFTGFNILIYYNSSMGYGIKNSGNGDCLITLNRITRGGLGTFIGTGPTIYKNVYDNVTIGIWLFSSSSIIRENIIYIDPNAIGSDASGILIEATSNNYTPIIDSNYIETKSEGIWKSFGTNPTIKNNTIMLRGIGARGIRGGGIPDSLIIFNNLIYAVDGFNGINSNVINARVFNNHITGNFNGRMLQIYDNNVVKNNVITNGTSWGVYRWGTGNLVFQYNNVWNNAANYFGFTPDTTNLSVDPMVVNEDNTEGKLDFHLQAFSPLIDAGDPAMIDKDSSRIDIGLYGGLYGDIYKYLDLPPRPPRNLTGVVDTGMITIRWNSNTEADFSYYKLFRDTSAGFTADSSTFVMSLTDTFYLHIIPPDIDKYYYKLTATDNQGNESSASEEIKVIITSVTAEDPIIISSYILYQNYPNPFNPSTKIGYKLKERGYVKLYVYSVSGELVSVLVNQNQEAGYYEVEFDAKVLSSEPALPSGRYGVVRQLASGVYIYQLIVKNENNLPAGRQGIPVFSDMKKMIYLK